MLLSLAVSYVRLCDKCRSYCGRAKVETNIILIKISIALELTYIPLSKLYRESSAVYYAVQGGSNFGVWTKS